MLLPEQHLHTLYCDVALSSNHVRNYVDLHVCCHSNHCCRYLQEWIDKKLTWDVTEYGGVDHLYVPSEKIWLPDIVLYNK